MSPPTRSAPAADRGARSESLGSGLDGLECNPAAQCSSCGGRCRATVAIAALGGRDVLADMARRRRVNDVLRPRPETRRRRSAPCDNGVGAWPWLVNADPRYRPVDFFASVLLDDEVGIDNRLAAVELFADRWGDATLVQALRAAHRLAPLHPRLALLLRRLTLAAQR